MYIAKAAAAVRRGSPVRDTTRMVGMHVHVVLAPSQPIPLSKKGATICTNCGFQNRNRVVDGHCVGECEKW